MSLSTLYSVYIKPWKGAVKFCMCVQKKILYQKEENMSTTKTNFSYIISLKRAGKICTCVQINISYIFYPIVISRQLKTSFLYQALEKGGKVMHVCTYNYFLYLLSYSYQPTIKNKFSISSLGKGRESYARVYI